MKCLKKQYPFNHLRDVSIEEWNSLIENINYNVLIFQFKTDNYGFLTKKPKKKNIFGQPFSEAISDLTNLRKYNLYDIIFQILFVISILFLFLSLVSIIFFV